MNFRSLLHDGLAAVLNNRARLHHGGCLRVLMFHGLTDRVHTGLENCQHKHLHVERFEKLVAHLASNYDVLSMDEVAASLADGRPLPAYAAVLTFDDGFASNYELAFPILRHYGVPAIIYLATEFVDEKTPIWADRVDYAMHKAGKSKAELETLKRRLKLLPYAETLAAVDELEAETGHRLGRADRADLPAIYRPLTWDQVREMARSGLVTFGSHTHHHVILGRTAPEVMRSELQTSRAIIERETGVSCRHFCYPNGATGDFSDISEQVLREAGFQSSITTIGGFNTPPCQPYLLRRLGMTNDLRSMQLEQYLAMGTASMRGLIEPAGRRHATE